MSLGQSLASPGTKGQVADAAKDPSLGSHPECCHQSACTRLTYEQIQHKGVLRIFTRDLRQVTIRQLQHHPSRELRSAGETLLFVPPVSDVQQVGTGMRAFSVVAPLLQTSHASIIPSIAF